MCDYHDGDKAILWIDNENNAFIDSQGEIFVTVKDKTIRFKVDYCPMCGHKFGSEKLPKFGSQIWYVDFETGEIEEGEVVSVQYKDGELDSFSVKFKETGDFDEFYGHGWGDCFFESKEMAENALLKGRPEKCP